MRRNPTLLESPLPGPPDTDRRATDAHASGWSGPQLAVKRVIDLCLGGLMAVLTLPVVIALALTSFAVYRAWPFFVQDRLGQHNRLIRVPKIRTLPPTFPAYALKPAVDADEHIPPIMRWIRARHLDEMPQLWLCVTGDMSLVGPRPKMPDEHEPVDEGYAHTRTLVPQGCTCLWQVGADKHLLPSEAPAYDVIYVREGTLRMDLWIMWRTVLTVIGVGGAIDEASLPAWARRSDGSDADALRVTT